MAPGTAEEPSQRVYRHLLYIGTVPARTGRTLGHRNRSSEVGGAVPRNRLPPRHHSAEKQAAIRTQINKLLELDVIEESQASEWSQAHPVPKSDGQW